MSKKEIEIKNLLISNPVVEKKSFYPSEHYDFLMYEKRIFYTFSLFYLLKIQISLDHTTMLNLTVVVVSIYFAVMHIDFTIDP